MPWTAEDAERHSKKADSPKRQRLWAEIANSVLAETGDERRAIREANTAVAAQRAILAVQPIRNRQLDPRDLTKK